MGVITTCALDEGTLFGPIPTTLTLADPAVLIGHRTCDTLPDIHTVKLDIREHDHGSRLAEWVPYVQAARDSVEQNMEAFLSDGQLYFRASRDVPPNSELLVWYSDKYATHLGVPELYAEYKRGDTYYCPKCREHFQYPNCLRAHMKFRCKYRQQLNSVSTFKIAETSGTTGSGSASETGKNTHQERINNIWSPSSELRSSSSPGDRSSQFSPDTRSTSSSGSPAAVTSGLRFAKRKQKESLEELSELSPKRSSATFLSSPSPTGSTSSMSPPQLNPDPRRSELSHQDDHAKSAFQRVDKILVTPGAHQLNKPTNLTSSAVISPRESPPSFATSSSVLTPTTALNMSLADKSVDIGLLPHGGMMLFPNFPRLAVHRGHEGLQRLPVANENAPYYAAAAAMNGLHYMNNNNNNINKSGLKMPPCLPTDPRMAAAAAALPFFYRAPNPMMGKMFHPAAAAAAAAAAGPPIPSTFAALNLTQNWCAKCNTSFRMTSDLVYHMRSHHKREFDPVKKKKDDKLKCDVCGESFRERHHLTRHMTSHT